MQHSYKSETELVEVAYQCIDDVALRPILANRPPFFVFDSCGSMYCK